MKLAVITALLAKVNNTKLNRFATMPEEETNREQIFAMTAAREGSGVRARWVELPDCNNEADLPSGEIALKYDLSNAVIATCKGYGVSADRYGKIIGRDAPDYDEGSPTYWETYDDTAATEKAIWQGLGKNAFDRKPLYDPVMHEDGWSVTGWRIGQYEHQVTQQQNGTVEATVLIPDDQTIPSWESQGGELNADGDGTPIVPNRVSGSQWQSLTGGGFKYSEEEWEDLPALDPVEAQADLANYNSKTYPYVAANATILVQLEDDVLAQKNNEKKWVELPDCDGSADEVPLEVDHAAGGTEEAPTLLPHPNGTVATCKTRVGGATNGAALDALDSVTPGF